MTDKVGLVVNPIAGMGGPVGLKGTDGADILDEALRRGASRRSAERAREAVGAIALRRLDIHVLTCAGDMGEAAIRGSGLGFDVVYEPATPSTAEDTRRAVRTVMGKGAALVLFCGGDGTARDVAGVVAQRVPVVGIPAGVKMHSSVFALTPADAADLVEAFVNTKQLRDGEVMDVDEDDFRDGVVRAKLYGIVRVPDDVSHLQPAKSSHSSAGSDSDAGEIADYLVNGMSGDILYILGPGSTTVAIARAMGMEKTPLGVDAYANGELVGRDLSERGLLQLLESYPAAVIVVTPIGSQGFIFGRGNQQISPAVIRRVGAENIVVVATPSKLKDTPHLRVDTGDSELDSELRRPVKVLTGYGRRRLVDFA